jgi:hypothetical protein
LALRIAFDLDGVFADMDAALAREAEALFGAAFARRAAPDADPDGAEAGMSTDGPALATHADNTDRSAAGDVSPPPIPLQMSSRQQRRLWHHVAGIENFWETLAEIEPGSIARLGALSTERGWELIFLTRRPETAGGTSQAQTQRWLEAQGFPRPSVFVVQGSRGKIAAALALDFVVDDTPQNCLDVVVDSNARAVLVWRQQTEQLPAAARRLGIAVVTSVGECLDVLADADAAATGERAGIVARVLRRLGVGGKKN